LSLPSPASLLAVQIVQAAARPSVSVNELVNTCQLDPAFVMRLLSRANSAAFAANRKVTSVQHAVSLLGVRGTRNLALASCVGEMAPSGSDGDALLGLCLRRGIASKLIAQRTGTLAPEDGFCMGMLLDTGLLVKASNNLKGASELARLPSATRCMVERAAGQEEHTRLGARLTKAWHLDDELVAAIAHHHDVHAPRLALGAVGWLAERLAAVFEGGDVSRNRLAAVEGGAQLGLSAHVVDELLKAIPTAVQEVAAEFQRDVGPQRDIDLLLRDANAALVEINRTYGELVAQLESLLKEKERLAQELEAANTKLTSLALTDGLTGLHNHRAFQSALTRELARADRERSPLSLVVLDADHFKQVNDTHGHPVGDAVLGKLAEILQRTIRVSDLAARVGGEEFALLLPDTDAEGALVVAERARSAVAQTVMQGPATEFQLTISLGIAMTRGPGCRGRERALYEAADTALYAAKQAGRNRTVIGDR
jgi:diguanylate cyclase (GGDEF)-like protein